MLIVLMMIALALCAPVVQAVAAEQAAVAVDGEVEYGKLIPINLAVGIKDHPDLVQLQGVTFVQEESMIHTSIRATMLSGPKGMWQVTVYLLDKTGEQIAAARATFENSGIIEGIPLIDQGTLDVALGPLAVPARVSRFRITLAEAPKDAEPNAVLAKRPERLQGTVVEQNAVATDGEIEYDKIIPVLLAAGVKDRKDLFTGEIRDWPDLFQLYWVTFHLEGSTIHVTLRATLVSYPKGVWHVTVSLLDKDSKQITALRATMENSGDDLDGYGMIREGDISADATDVVDASRVKRFKITLAQAPQSAEANAELSDFISYNADLPEQRECDIVVTVLDPQGKPANAKLTIWRAVEGPGPDLSRSLSVMYGWPGRPNADGKTWVLTRYADTPKHIKNLSQEVWIRNLPPGLYRVVASTIHEGDDLDPTPFGISEIIDLTSQNRARITMQLKAGTPLVVKVPGPQKPHWGWEPYIGLVRSDGFVIAATKVTRLSGDTDFRFSNVEPGTYTLEIGWRDWWCALHPDAVKKMNIEIKPDVENTVTVPYIESPWQSKIKRAE